ncbi:hypothetical protein FKM82_028810, partial [Ascaphus truei]
FPPAGLTLPLASCRSDLSCPAEVLHWSSVSSNPAHGVSVRGLLPTPYPHIQLLPLPPALVWHGGASRRGAGESHVWAALAGILGLLILGLTQQGLRTSPT